VFGPPWGNKIFPGNSECLTICFYTELKDDISVLALKMGDIAFVLKFGGIACASTSMDERATYTYKYSSTVFQNFGFNCQRFPNCVMFQESTYRNFHYLRYKLNHVGYYNKRVIYWANFFLFLVSNVLTYRVNIFIPRSLPLRAEILAERFLSASCHFVRVGASWLMADRCILILPKRNALLGWPDTVDVTVDGSSSGFG